MRQLASNAISVIVTVVLLSLGTGLLASGQVAVGALCVVYAAWNVGIAGVARWGTDRVMAIPVVARPFFFGAWLVALALVILVAGRSLDWVLILPLCLLGIGLGVWVFVRARGRRRR